jgi:LIM domain
LSSVTRALGGIDDAASTPREALRRFDVDAFLKLLVASAGQPVLALVKELLWLGHNEAAALLKAALTDLLHAAQALRKVAHMPDATVVLIVAARDRVIDRIKPLLDALQDIERYLMGRSEQPLARAPQDYTAAPASRSHIEGSAASPRGQASSNGSAAPRLTQSRPETQASRSAPAAPQPTQSRSAGADQSPLPHMGALTSALADPKSLEQNLLPLLQEMKRVLELAEAALPKVHDPALRAQLSAAIDALRRALADLANQARCGVANVDDSTRQRLIQCLGALLDVLKRAQEEPASTSLGHGQSPSSTSSSSHGYAQSPRQSQESSVSGIAGIAELLRDPARLKANFSAIIEQLRNVVAVARDARSEIRDAALQLEFDATLGGYVDALRTFAIEAQSGASSAGAVQLLVASLEKLEAMLAKARDAAHVHCSSCRKPINGQYVSLGDNVAFHEHCFCCSVCNRAISRYVMVGGKIFCAEHAPSTTAGAVDSCSMCGQPLVGQYLEALGGKYHRGCLRCQTCAAPLAEQFYTLDGKPFCATCSQNR